MKTTISKKSAFVISINYRKWEDIINPLPGEHKRKLKTHSISLFILTDIKELVSFLNKYTRFSQYQNNDFLQDKQWLKDSPRFIVEIEDFTKFKKDILCDPPRGFLTDYHEKEYPEKYISIARLPLTAGKRFLNEDLY
ncbi:MAG: hypothetical protein J6O88_05945 [Chryseobacterium sp.]|uniref:hypothetical protein n=1 Tax=Chryseobacterium sp. TaxID=1871047 RepID=UPI001B0F3F19|nr:hypothetical protein [Chryseobacterium sp.]MBO6184225.1 hypothetical protein [Chryseobacterium sp.]